MPKILAIPVEPQGLSPFELSGRLRGQLCYFVCSPGPEAGGAFREDEYWFDPVEVDRWLDEGVFYLVSPLDTANQTEVEISEEQEDFLTWLKANGVRHIRVQW